MSIKFLAIAFLFCGSFSWAKSEAPKKDTTTYTVQHGEPDDKPEFEVTSGSGEVEGDPAVLKNEARKSWKDACEKWKAEIKDLNKKEQVLSLNCGAAQCAAEGGQTTCHSAGEYKIKVRVRSH